jgi:hypothetical protein
MGMSEAAQNLPSDPNLVAQNFRGKFAQVNNTFVPWIMSWPFGLEESFILVPGPNVPDIAPTSIDPLTKSKFIQQDSWMDKQWYNIWCCIY